MRYGSNDDRRKRPEYLVEVVLSVDTHLSFQVVLALDHLSRCLGTITVARESLPQQSTLDVLYFSP
jgi:hypothetical protein